jgi:hypothetical protein
MPVDRQAVQVEFAGRAGDLDESVWRDCFRDPLEGLFWYHTLETSSLEDQFTFSYGLIKMAGKPVGIAPCFLHDVPITLVAPRPVAAILTHLSKVFPRVGYQRTFFVGSPCSDEGTIGLIPGIKLADVVHELGHAVRHQARQLTFRPSLGWADFFRRSVIRAPSSRCRLPARRPTIDPFFTPSGTTCSRNCAGPVNSCPLKRAS